LAGPRIQLVATPASGPHGRIGFIIARVHLARAVDRNRLRRLMREAARERRPALDAFDLVLRLRVRCGRASLTEAGQEAATLLDSLLERA
jgi:ribonuclease P protein component